MKKSTRYAAIILFLIMTFADIGGMCVILPDLPIVMDQKRLVTHGAHAHGHVTGRWVSPGKHHSSYYVAYEYTVSGRTYSHRNSTGVLEYDEMQKGRDVDVSYLSESPKVCSIQGAWDTGSTIAMDAWLFTLMIFGTVVFTLVIVYTVRSERGAALLEM